MLTEPLTPPQARKLIRLILQDGIVTYAQPHAVDRMAKRQISMVDCENVLYGGSVRHPELENGTWRYQVHTAKMCVVIRFEDETCLQIVTVWRKP
jgi:hypothetical protein